MIILISTIIYTVHLIVQHSNCITSLNLPQTREALSAKWALRGSDMYERYPRKKGLKLHRRRFSPKNDKPEYNIYLSASRRQYEDEKNAHIKSKVASLMEQTLHDTEIKMKAIDKIKEKHKQHSVYKIGFVLSTVKKARDVLNELFDVAIKHRDEWKTLEQLKIFELIMHTNVDITHYVKLLVEIHDNEEMITDTHNRSPESTSNNDDNSNKDINDTAKASPDGSPT